MAVVTWGDFKNLKCRVERLQTSRIRTKRADREFDERMKKAFAKHKVCSHLAQEHLDERTRLAYEKLVGEANAYAESIRPQLSRV